MICSDKTGTLTLNKMTARELAIPGQHRFTVTGEGYSTEGEIRHVGGSHIDLDPYLLPMILCADAVLDGTELIGDPTEGALIVLAAKGGLDIAETRASYPRVAEVPFDSDHKFMATFHQMTGAGGKPIDIPIAVALGFDEPTGGLIGRPPRPVGAPVLSRANWVRLCIQRFVMTAGASPPEPSPRCPAPEGGTMLLVVVRHADAGDKRTWRGPVEPLGRDRMLRIESVPALGVDTSPAE